LIFLTFYLYFDIILSYLLEVVMNLIIKLFFLVLTTTIPLAGNEAVLSEMDTTEVVRVKTTIHKLIPRADGTALIIIEDKAKTTFLTEQEVPQQWQVGSTLSIKDPYRVKNESMMLKSGDTAILAKRLGGMDHSTLLEIDLIDWGSNAFYPFFKGSCHPSDDRLFQDLRGQRALFILV
jgi:hypothetical protein